MLTWLGPGVPRHLFKHYLGVSVRVFLTEINIEISRLQSRLLSFMWVGIILSVEGLNRKKGSLQLSAFGLEHKHWLCRFWMASLQNFLSQFLITNFCVSVSALCSLSFLNGWMDGWMDRYRSLATYISIPNAHIHPTHFIPANNTASLGMASGWEIGMAGVNVWDSYCQLSSNMTVKIISLRLGDIILNS